MKRIIAIISAAVMLTASVFAGTALAAEKEDIVGTWYIQSMKQGEIEMDASTLAAMGMNMTITLNEDETAVMDATGSESQEGTWSFEKSTITFGNEVPFTIEDGQLILDQDGSTAVLGKEPAEAADTSLAPAVTDPKPEDFEGDWIGTTYAAFGIPLPLSLMGVGITVTIKDGKAFLHEDIIDLNNNGEVTESKDMEFDTELQEDGTLYIDFNGEDVLSQLGMDASGVNLTLHEDGRISATSPEIIETLAMLAQLSEEINAETEDDPEAAPAEETEDTGDSDSDSYSMEMYLILEKAE